MAYLIDTSCLIDCKNQYYSFEICPGFWEWLELKNREGVLFSIEQCKGELTDGKDRLADWASKIESTFFLPTDVDTVATMKHVVDWVENNTKFERHIKARFMDKADPFLIACSVTHNHKIITHETYDPNKLKIPTVCRSMDVECISIFKVIKDSGARFVLHR